MRNMLVREMREGCGTETRGGSSKVIASNAGSNQNDVTGGCGVVWLHLSKRRWNQR